ncbi:hypothetical protein FRAHR75_1970008 [Frankia sp. Hr75.2]|nr:hypothetical protein FRAHR75_1970008 [Frankia sp. Hr75.2]
MRSCTVGGFWGNPSGVRPAEEISGPAPPAPGDLRRFLPLLRSGGRGRGAEPPCSRRAPSVVPAASMLP